VTYSARKATKAPEGICIYQGCSAKADDCLLCPEHALAARQRTKVSMRKRRATERHGELWAWAATQCGYSDTHSR
jgi:hypothetical protein